MARQPEYIEVDTVGAMALRSFAPAEASLLSQASNCQHALMSGFGGPLQVFSAYADGFAGTTTIRVPVRVPPGVTRCRVGAVGQGFFAVVFTTADDPNGAGLASPFATVGNHLSWQWGGTTEGDLGALESRLLRLSASATETWRTIWVAAQVSVSDVFGFAFQPVHLVR